MIDAALALCGALAVAFAGLALFQRSLLSSAMCLLAVLLQLAAAFFLVGAQLLGLFQVLVYAGAVMVLLVIAAASSPPRLSSLWSGTGWLGWLIVLGLLGEAALFAARFAAGDGWDWPAPGIERRMAAVVFGPYAVLTETVGVLVFVASLAILQESPETEGWRP